LRFRREPQSLLQTKPAGPFGDDGTESGMTVELTTSALKAITVGLFLGAAIMATAAYAQVAGQVTDPQFIATSTSGRAPLAVEFSYPYTSETSTWILNIDFGDGATDSLQSPCPSGAVNCNSPSPWKGTRTYSAAGTYRAVLTRGGLPLCFGCPAPVLGTVTITVTAGP
jgi:hypothetical protein